LTAKVFLGKKTTVHWCSCSSQRRYFIDL